MIKIDLNKREHLKLQIKLTVRSLFPQWFLSATKRRQVPIKKMLEFIREHTTSKINTTSKKSGDITIIVPCYNHSQYLRDTFMSIINQTRKPDAVIFINDKSTDDTEYLLEKLVSDYTVSEGYNKESASVFSIIHNKINMGQAMTINKGVLAANTEFIMILNDDDYLMHDAIEITMDTYKANPDIVLFGGGCIPFSDESFLERSKKKSTENIDKKNVGVEIRYPEDAVRYEDYCSLNMTHSGSSFSKRHAESVGLYKEKKERIVPFSDRDFQIRMNLLYPIGFCSGLPLCFWRSNSSVDSGRNS